MGSAENSGVSGSGFGSKPARSGQAASPRLKRDPLSPASLFFIFTALAGCLAFIAYDAYRTISEVNERLELIAALAAAQIAPREINAPRDQPFSIPPTLSQDTQFALAAADGEILASTIPKLETGSIADEALGDLGAFTAQASIAGDLAEITVAIPHWDVARTLSYRAGGALGAVLVVLMLMIGRSRANPGTANALEPGIEAVPYGFARWNRDGVLVCSNAAFGKLLRIEPMQFCAGTAYEAVSKTIAGKITGRPLLDARHQRVVEVERDDGTAIMLDERPCAHGGFVTIVTDISDRKAADRMLSTIREEQRQLARRYHEEKLRAEMASRAKTSFLAHLSHDIRTPLNHIIGFADLIRLETYGPLGDPKYQTYLGDIKESGQRLLTSLAEILEYAELEGGRRELKCERIALNDLLFGAAARFRSQAARAGIRLDVSGDHGGALNADRHCLDRMVGNLLDNAIRFTPRGGEIRLTSWMAGDGVVIEISDTGVGISEDQLSRLSEPFAHPDASFTKSSEGAGLGIAIARTIAELSGGRLAIDSMAGVGTTVAISLPLEAADAQAEAVKAA